MNIQYQENLLKELEITASEYSTLYDEDAIKLNITIIKLDKELNGENIKYPQAYTRLAKCYLENNQREKADAIYKKVLDMKNCPDLQKIASYYISKIIFYNTQKEDAQENFKKIYNLIETYEEAIVTAISMRRKRSFGTRNVSTILEKALVLSTNQYEKLRIACEFKKLKNHARAGEILEELMAHNNSDKTVQIAYASLLRRSFRDIDALKEAENIYEEILSKEPKNKAALVGYGALLCDTRQYTKAYECCMAVNKIDPYDPYYLRLLARIGININDCKKTLNACKILKAYYSHFKPLRYLDAVIVKYKKSGYCEDAARMLEVKNRFQ